MYPALAKAQKIGVEKIANDTEYYLHLGDNPFITDIQGRTIECIVPFTRYQNQKISIQNSVYIGSLRWDHSAFFGPSLIFDVIWAAPVTLSQDTFRNAVSIKKSNFFESCDFKENTYFGESSFIEDTFAHADFSFSNFNESAEFSKCKFQGDCEFEMTVFNNGANFSECIVNKKISFISSNIFKKLDLSQSYFESSVSLKNTSLPDTIDLSGMTYLSEAFDLTEEQDSRTVHLINLYNCPIEKLKLNYKKFKLYFPSSLTDEQKTVIYERLLGNFKNHNQNEDYERLDIEYQDSKNKLTGWFQHNFLLCYGYHKYRILYNTPIILAILTAINSLCLRRMLYKVYKVEYIYDKYRENFHFTVGERLWYSLIYTSMIFFAFSLKIENINLSNKLGVTYLIFIYILGIICLAYLANYVLQRG